MASNIFAAIVFKTTAENQIASALRDFPATKAAIYFNNDGRINEEEIRSWKCLETLDSIVKPILFSEMTKVKVRSLLESEGRARAVAMPLIVGFPYWGNVRYFKKTGATVINISDGTAENTTVLDSFIKLKLQVGRPQTWLKTLIVPPVVRAVGLADLAYHPFAPDYANCFARRTLEPIASAPKCHTSDALMICNIIKRELPTVMIVGGISFSAEWIATKFRVKSWIATSKSKEVHVNGRTIPLNQHFSAEDLLDLFQPKAVIGCISDAISAAKKRWPGVRCIAIIDPAINRKWGSFHNLVFRRQNRRFNLDFVEPNDLDKVARGFRL